MAFRGKMKKARSKSNFTKYAKKTHRKNIQAPPRGGFML